jgi:hypothetical protein
VKVFSWVHHLSKLKPAFKGASRRPPGAVCKRECLHDLQRFNGVHREGALHFLGDPSPYRVSYTGIACYTQYTCSVWDCGMLVDGSGAQGGRREYARTSLRLQMWRSLSPWLLPAFLLLILAVLQVEISARGGRRMRSNAGLPRANATQKGVEVPFSCPADVLTNVSAWFSVFATPWQLNCGEHAAINAVFQASPSRRGKSFINIGAPFQNKLLSESPHPSQPCPHPSPPAFGRRQQGILPPRMRR